MRLHGKKGTMMHKDGHHHLKRKHFKYMMLRSTLDKDDLPCKKKHFKRMMKARSMMTSGHHGKWKHVKGMGGQSSSSSDSDDDDHHQGKKKHFKRMMQGSTFNKDDLPCKKKHFKRMMKACSMLTPEHHGKGKHFKGMRGQSSSSDSDDSDHHHGKKMHFKRMRGQRLSHSDDDHTNKGMQGEFMSDVGRNHHQGKGKDVQGQSTSRTADEGMQGRCMSENEGSRHHGKMNFMGMRRRCMTDIEEGRHGRGKHFKGMQWRHDSDDVHHDKGKHVWGMMNHHKERHWKKGYNKRGFFDEDGALVPICSTEGENHPETMEKENTGNQATEAAEVTPEDVAKTRDQGTQTSGIMEIVIEDQEAQNAAIRIVNKFL